MVEMITPQQRLDRMRKSFAKDKGVLSEDYKYFTTPDAPATPQRLSSIPISMLIPSLADDDFMVRGVC